MTKQPSPLVGHDVADDPALLEGVVVVTTVNCRHDSTQREHHLGRDVWLTCLVLRAR